MNYTVVGGETLKTIARNVLGDSSLWWRIADANGLAVSGDGELTAGQTLSIPKLALNANNADTFQPYDPSRVTGSLDSVLPAPAGQGGGCGALGKIIMVAVAVVVAAMVGPAITAALQNAAFASLGSGALSSAGFATLASAAPVLGTAAGATLGSITSQAAGNLMGVQDGFSWKQVGLAAIAGGVSGGLQGMNFTSATAIDGGAASFGNVIARATVGNVLSQGIGVVTGLQDRFDWKSVAASAAGGAVGSYVGEQLKSPDLFKGWDTSVAELVRGSISGFAAGTAAAVAHGGRISIQQVATDAFGNALGSSLLDHLSNPGTTASQPASSSQLQASSIPDTDPVGMGGAYGIRPGRGGYGLIPSADPLAQWSNEIDGGIMLNGSLAPVPGNTIDRVTVGSNQGPLAALAAAGLDARQQNAMYGQLLANGTIRLNSQGVPMIRPGQVLEFDLSDMSSAKLGGNAVAQESRMRIASDLAAQRQYLDRNDAQLRGQIEEQFSAGISRAQWARTPLIEQIPGGPELYTVPSNTSRVNEPIGYLLEKVDNLNNSPIGMALQGLPPEGLAIGGIRAGLRWVGKSNNISEVLMNERKLAESPNLFTGPSHNAANFEKLKDTYRSSDPWIFDINNPAKMWDLTGKQIAEGFRLAGHNVTYSQNRKSLSEVYTVAGHPNISKFQFTPDYASSHGGQYYKFILHNGSEIKIVDPLEYMSGTIKSNTIILDPQGLQLTKINGQWAKSK
ncbi:hypothetical protein BW39_04651 [Delftia sp. RIT313]|nr:hypothetical protein BW39_04651 [Delftia sp. RIT313]